MPRKFWGEFKIVVKSKPKETDKVIPNAAKKTKLEEMHTRPLVSVDKNVKLKINSHLVTQTIEVMKQTEMLQSLIDTYSNKSGTSNYLLNPCQMIPEVDFPPENATDFVRDDKFMKPIWFIPPEKTLIRAPKHYIQVNADVRQASMRKAVCGLLRVAGFIDIEESALLLFTDAIAEFEHTLVQQLRELHDSDENRETQREVEGQTLEKCYYELRNVSLAQLYNYYKHNIISRNRTEIAEFNGVLQEYDKLMKESMQSMQKNEIQEGDFINILEIPQSSDGHGGTPVINVVECQPQPQPQPQSQTQSQTQSQPQPQPQSQPQPQPPPQPQPQPPTPR